MPDSSSTLAAVANINPEQMEEVQAYLDQHRLPIIFQHLTAALLFHRPENPKQFMVEQLAQLQSFKKGYSDELPLLLFSKANLTSLFQVLDVNNTGFITSEQYLKAMNDIGVTKFNRVPAGYPENRITLQSFLEEAESALRNVFK